MNGQDKQTELNVHVFDEELRQYFVNVASVCPYGLPHKAVYRQAICGWLDESIMGCFLANGYRRNGNSMYDMRCPDCKKCVPIRLQPEYFKPNRSQRRVWQKNKEITVGVAPLTMSRENLNLLELFLNTRFPDGKSQAEGYYTGFFITSITRCFEIRYRLDDRLVGVSIVDGSPRWLNAVYFFFDPAFSRRSPGIYNILYLINFCRAQKIDYLYLGYLIEGVGAMEYKKHFSPHELLVDGAWQKKTNV